MWKEIGLREGRIVVGSRYRRASNLPIPVPLSQGAGKERIPRAGSPSPLRLLSSPPRNTWRRSQGWGQSRAVTFPPPNSGPTAARHGGAGGITRGLGTEGRGGGKEGASGGSSWLFKLCAREGAGSVLPPPPARGSARPGVLSLASILCGSYAHFPLGSRPARIPIPSPVSISPCAGAPPAPSLLTGSPARRERKVNGQPNHKDKLP